MGDKIISKSEHRKWKKEENISFYDKITNETKIYKIFHHGDKVWFVPIAWIFSQITGFDVKHDSKSQSFVNVTAMKLFETLTGFNYFINFNRWTKGKSWDSKWQRDSKQMKIWIF